MFDMDKNNIRKISLEGWTLFSERRNSLNYVSEDGKYMLKFASGKADGDLKVFLDEYEVCKRVEALGIPTGACREVIQDENGRYGIIYDYLQNKKSVLRSITQDPDNMEDYIKRFVESSKKFHDLECDTSFFPSNEDRILEVIKTLDCYTEEQRDVIRKIVSLTPRSTKCLQGDFHTGNTVFSNGKTYLIDLGLLAYGNEIYDLGVFAFFTQIFGPETRANYFHIPDELVQKMFRTFISYYYDIKDPEKIEEKVMILKGYALVSMNTLFGVINGGEEYASCVRRCFDEVTKPLLEYLTKK